MNRGELWWASLPTPVGSGPGYRRPVLVVQADPFNASRIQTVIVAAVTSNARRANAPGNVLLTRKASRLDVESVVNVSQLLTVDKALLDERIAVLSGELMLKVEAGLRMVLQLTE